MTLNETARRRIGRVVAPLYTVPGHGLRAVDAARGRQSTPTAPLPPPPADVAPQLLITIAHWRSSPAPVGALRAPRDPAGAERVGHLVDVLSTALALPAERVTVAITTNHPAAVTADLRANVGELPAGTVLGALRTPGELPGASDAARSVLVWGWRPSGPTHRHPYYLTWSHKQLLRSGLQDPRFSHFLYLEDDLPFTAQSLGYWQQYREPLAAHGLLPGFVRVESLDGSTYVVDQSRPIDASRLAAVTVGSGPDALRFVGLPNAYQGMYVLDRLLAIEHFARSAARDPWRSRALVDWGIRERAAVGPILDAVPSGFIARNVVPVRAGDFAAWTLDECCTLVHLPGNYTRGAHPDFGIVRVSDLFAVGGPGRQGEG